MLAKKYIVCLLAALGVVSFGSASAITFEVQTDNVGPVAQGGSLNASILVSGLGAFSAPSLGAYDLGLTYDPTRFAFDSATFGDPVLGNQLDLSGFGSFNGAVDLLTAVNVFEVSFDSSSDLDTLQADAFTLVTVTFDVLFNAGIGAFDLAIIEIGDSLADTLYDPDDPPTLIGAKVSVVPVPAAVWLFGSALLGLIGVGRRRLVAGKIDEGRGHDRESRKMTQVKMVISK